MTQYRQMKLSLLVSIALSILVITPPATAADRVVLYYFYGTGCPNCAKTQSIVEGLARKYRDRGLVLISYEVWYNKKNRDLMLALSQERGKSIRGVPAVIIGADVFTGVREIFGIESRIGRYLR